MTTNLKRLDLIFKNEGDSEAILEKTLSRNNDDIISDLIASGIKGRGGAGFPTGLKWRLTGEVEADQKYVICNADEGEPGTFKDREILSNVPHKVLTGMAVCARIIGATKGFIYLRNEYKFLVPKLRTALDDFHLLMDKLNLDFRVDIFMGSGFCVPRKRFEKTIIGYQGKLTGVSLPTGGSMMIFNSSRSMYNVLHNYLEFFVEESCGQCTPCRVGTQQLLMGIEAVKRGDKSSDYLNKLLDLSEIMRQTAKCGLGQSVANSFSSIVENFKEEMIY
jgi:NADH:ubiquinone oxidoreductase subunit F (NADH-binding)